MSRFSLLARKKRKNEKWKNPLFQPENLGVPTLCLSLSLDRQHPFTNTIEKGEEEGEDEE
jgi:hypothetical protein